MGLLRAELALRVRCLDIDLHLIEKIEQSLADEESELAGYDTKRKEYEEGATGLGDIVLRQRQQKSIQLEFTERNRRLYLARYNRIRALQEAKAKQLSEEASAEGERKHLLALAKGKKTPMQKFAERCRKATRRTKDGFVNWRHGIKNTFDEEEERMSNFLKTRAKASMKGRPQGIAALHITTTQEEMFKFEAQNAHLESKGLPYFTKHVLLGGMVWLWAQTSWEAVDFITHIHLSHGKPGHRLNRSEQIKALYDSMGEEYEVVRHRGQPGKAGANDTPLELELWICRQEGKTKGLLEMVVSSSEAEEVRYAVNDFIKVEPQEEDEESHLLSYGIPAAPGNLLWWRKVPKTIGRAIAPEQQTVNELMLECNKLKKLREDFPDDATLVEFEKGVQQKLRDAYAREKEAEVRWSGVSGWSGWSGWRGG